MQRPQKTLTIVPVDVLAEIAHLLLDDELPGPATLVPLSIQDPDSVWRVVPPASARRNHAPPESVIGGGILYRLPSHGENCLSVFNLSHVNKIIRSRMLDLPGVWARCALHLHVDLLETFAYRAQPGFIDMTSWKAQDPDKLRVILRFVHAARSMRLSLPAYTQSGHESSHAFCAEIRATGKHLNALELRFATPVGGLQDAGASYPCPSPGLSDVQLLNSHFTFVGPSIRRLCLGQQSAQLRWRAAVVCEVIIACPQLEELVLHTVIQPHIEVLDQELLPEPENFNGTIDTDLIMGLPELKADRLRSLYLSDEASTCTRMLRQFSSIEGDLHVDAIIQLGSRNVVESLDVSRIFRRLQPLVVACRRHFEAGERGRTAVTTFTPDRGAVDDAFGELWDNWPEHVFVGLASNEDDALLMTGSSADFTPLLNRRRCSFAIRNDALSTRPGSQTMRDERAGPKPALVMEGLLQTVSEFFQLAAVKFLVLPPRAYIPEAMVNWRRVLHSFQELQVISVALKLRRSAKSLGHYLRESLRSEDGSLIYPLIGLEEVMLPALDDQRGSWRTRGAFNRGMRNLMERSPREGVPINWVAPLLPD